MKRTLRISLINYFVSVIFLLGVAPQVQALPKCLHVMSYHQGYEWNDGIDAGVENTLRGKCEIKKFYMDSKRNTSPEFIKKAALKAKKLIEDFQPDVVIASDDNASRYLVQVFYKNGDIPIVFNGINWTADAYGYPYKNTTGMVEVAPIKVMLEIAKRNTVTISTVVFLSDDVLSEHKNFEYFKSAYGRKGVTVTPIFVKNMHDWENGFVAAQTGDLVILGNNAGINDWDQKQAIRHVKKRGKKLTMTTSQWMMPYTMIGVSKIASEQGEWAAEVALEVLGGTAISSIPVTINRRWFLYQNKQLLSEANITVDKITRHKAVSEEWLYGNN